jgi:hypothetical protein
MCIQLQSRCFGGMFVELTTIRDVTRCLNSMKHCLRTVVHGSKISVQGEVL